jgi:hypothetical protein
MPVGVVLTRQGHDVGPLINQHAGAVGMPTRPITAQLWAESRLDEHAERWGTWPDWSFGLSQITVRYAPVGDQTARAANVNFVKDYYFQPENAIRDCARWLAPYWQQFSDLDEEQRYYETASRYNGGPGMAFADNPNAHNFREAWAAAAEYEQEAPMPAPATYTYDPTLPAVRQTDDWSCAVASTTWALQALGIPANYPAMEQAMLSAGLVSREQGLLDGSGQALADWITRQFGVTVEVNSDADWEWVEKRAGRGPCLLGGRGWYHWTAVRALRLGLALANPAPSWQDVGDDMSPDEFTAWGPWAALWLPVETPPEDDVTQAEYDALKAKYDELDSYTSALGHDILLPTVARIRRLAGVSSRTQTRESLQRELDAIADVLAPFVVR